MTNEEWQKIGITQGKSILVLRFGWVVLTAIVLVPVYCGALLTFELLKHQCPVIMSITKFTEKIGTPAQQLTLLIAVLAFVGGFYQWREQRRENSMDKWYSRLENGNKMLSENPEARELIRPIIDKSESPEKEKALVWVFNEIDNLEYGLNKFNEGYLSQKQFRVVVDAFENRCKSREFIQIAKTVSQRYDPEVRELVDRICAVTITRTDAEGETE